MEGDETEDLYLLLQSVLVSIDIVLNSASRLCLVLLISPGSLCRPHRRPMANFLRQSAEIFRLNIPTQQR